MMPGPTLGHGPQLSSQELFDAIQVNIADLADDKRLGGLLNVFSDVNTLSGLPGDLNGFADAVREGKLSNGQLVAQLENIAVKALRTLGKTTDEALQKRGTTYKDSSRAIVEHFYRIARNFGVQIDLANRLDIWAQNNPHTEDPKQQTFQEQKEAAFNTVERQFPAMIDAVTKEHGFGMTKVVDGCIQYMHEVMAGHGGPVSYYFGTADKFKLSPEDQAKRTEIMKEKIRPMVLEALQKNARKATNVIFEPLMKEMFPKESHIKGKTAAMIADDMIVTAIAKRSKKGNGQYPEYHHLAYYWPEDLRDYCEVNELRQNLIYLVQKHWGPALAADKHTSGQLERAKNRIDAKSDYFNGYAIPAHMVLQAAANEGVPPTVKEGKGNSAPDAPSAAQPVIPEGEGAQVHDLATMQAQLAARAAENSGVHPVPQAPKPKPSAEPSVIINTPTPAITPPGSRDAKTVPPARPKRPDIQISRPDLERTQTSAHRRAVAKQNGFAKWVQRGVLAVAAALGIVSAVSVYKGHQSGEADNKTASTVSTGNTAPAKTTATVAQNQAPAVAPSATSTVAPTPVASTVPSAAPTVAVVPTAVPTTSPPVAINNPPTPTVIPPAVVPPTKVGVNKPTPTAEYLASIKDADLKQIVEGEKSIRGPYSTDISAPFYRAAGKIADPVKRVEAFKKIGELHQKINRGAFASYMKRFARLSPQEVQKIATDKSHPEHNLLRYLMREDKTKMGMGPDVSRWNSKVPAVDASGKTVIENGKVKYVNYEERFAEEMEMYDKNFEGEFKTFGLDKRAPGNIHMGAWAGDKVSTFKDGQYLWYVQQLAGASGVELPKTTAAADPQGGGTAPQDAQPKGKSGFNQISPDNQVPGNIPTNILPGLQNGPAIAPDSKYGFAAPQSKGAEALPDSLDAELNAFNKGAVAKAADRKLLRDQQLAEEVAQHVRDEDQKLIDFETKRRSRGFFTKLSDACKYAWSGATPEECAEGIQGMGGIRGLFLTSARRNAELMKRADALMALDAKPAIAPVIDADAEKAQKAAEEKKAVASINRLRDQIMAADEMEKIDAGWDIIAAEHAQKAEKKKALRAELNGKMEKLFAKGKALEAERGPAPLIDFRKTYQVAAADKSIKFVLERQIKLSNLSEDAKEKALVAVQEMIRTNGAFIETYKMHPDGSRDLTLKDEYRAKLNEAAGVQVAMPPIQQVEEAVEKMVAIKDEDIIEVVDQKEAIAA